MKSIQFILFILIMLSSSEKCQAQGVQFIETSDIQRAMDEYKARFHDNAKVAGYRIQYLFTTDRREMEAIEKSFENIYENIPHEWEHDQPYYRLYAGSFIDRSNAMHLLVRIRDNFPAALLVNASVAIDKVLECRKNLNVK